MTWPEWVSQRAATAARKRAEAAQCGEERRLEVAAADAELQGLEDRQHDQGHGLGTPAERQQHIVEQRVAEGKWGEGQQLGKGERSEAGEAQQQRGEKSRGHARRERKRRKEQQAEDEGRKAPREGEAMDEE